MVLIREQLSNNQVEQLGWLLWTFNDIFAFSPEDMPGVDPTIAMHSLNGHPECKPMQQRKRRMNENKTVASITET